MKKIKCIGCGICSGNTIFKNLTEEQRFSLRKNMKNISFNNKDVIFYQGETPKMFYLIKEGIVKLTSVDGEGKEQLLRISRAGDILSYRSIFANEKCKGKAYSVKKTHICAFPKEDIYEMINNNMSFRDEFIKMLATKLREAEERMIKISYQGVESRVAYAILDFVNIYGFKEDGKTIDGDIYRKDIAQFVGISTESVIRFFKKLKEDKLIDINNKEISILDIKSLKSIIKPS